VGTFKFTTRISKGEAQLRSMDLVEVIKSPSLVSGVENQVDLDAIMPTEINDPYPVIILINGSGGCGKGTLIKQIRQYCNAPVYELSTVDPLRPVAKTLMEYQQDMFAGLFETDPMTASAEESEKGGPYRQFLSDLKYAWSNHNEGPNTYVVGLALKLITDNRWTIDENTGLPIRPESSPTTYNADGGMTFTLDTTYDMPAMIFINAREPKNLDELKNAFWELGLLCFTMKMEGIEHEAEDLADSDLLVNDYDYDIVVRNKGTVDDLSVLAFTMNTFVNRANRMYGVSVAESKIDQTEVLGQKVLQVINTEIDQASKDRGLFYGLLVGVSSGSLTSVTAFENMSLTDQFHDLEKRDKKALSIAAAKALSRHGYELKEAGSTYAIVTSVTAYLAGYPNECRAITLGELIDLTREIVRDVAFPFAPLTDVVYTNTSPKEEPLEPLPFRTNAGDIGGVRVEGSGLENANIT